MVSSTLRPGEPREQAAQAALGAQQSGDTEVVGLAQKVSGIDAVVAHEAEQGRAIAAPVQRAQPVRFGAFDAQRPFDVVGHAPVDRIEDRVRRVVQRVVEVEQPHRRARRPRAGALQPDSGDACETGDSLCGRFSGHRLVQ